MPSPRPSPASLGAATLLALLVLTPGARAAAPHASFPAVGELAWPALAVRKAPNEQAPRVRVLTQFRSDFRPRVVLAIGEARDAQGRVWLKLRLAGRPNGQTGWIRGDGVRLHPTKLLILISRGGRWLELRRDGRVLLHTVVAVGAPGMETPLGNFYVTARFHPANPFLGVYAFETSAYSKLSDWPGGGVVGIHGTSLPWLLGQAVSHGCVRVSNAAILSLKALVPLGTPIRIVP